MGYSTPKTKLYKIARLQQGFFTAKQAKEAGYSDSRFGYHVKQGTWIREGRGIYRLARYPQEERPDLVYWSLWSCDRSGSVQGVFSHETALSLYNLSDIMPAKYHLTVPKKFRKQSAIPDNVILHYATLQEDEVRQCAGYKVTSPERTLYDVLVDEKISEEIATQAISDSLEKGIVSQWMSD